MPQKARDTVHCLMHRCRWGRPLRHCRGKSQCGGFEAVLQNSLAQVCMHVTNQPVGVEVGSGEHVPRAVDPSDIW